MDMEQFEKVNEELATVSWKNYFQFRLLGLSEVEAVEFIQSEMPEDEERPEQNIRIVFPNSVLTRDFKPFRFNLHMKLNDNLDVFLVDRVTFG